MNVVARARHVLARRPWLYWLAVALLGCGVAAVVVDATSGIERARLAWGQTRDVLVATADVAPGDPVAAERRALPGPMVPEAAVGDVSPRAVARQHVAVGEVLVRADVAPTAAPQSMIPDGWVAVAVAEAIPTGVLVGDAVQPVAGGAEVGGAGVVVGRQPDAVLVAVPAADAPAVALAASTGELALLLAP